MNSRTLLAVLSLSGLAGFCAPLVAEGLPGMHCSTRKNYVSAMLAYDEKLKKDPFNHAAMKQLVSCHEAMLKNEQSSDSAKDSAKKQEIVTAQAADREEFPDLPKFSEDTGPSTLAAKP
jgi:hypothetical protein